LNGCIFDPFYDIPKVIMPGAGGGNDWAVTSYNPKTNQFYIAASVSPNSFSVRHEKIDPLSGLRVNLGGGGVTTPIGTKNSGTFTAIDASTNKIAWQKEMQYPIGTGSGSLTTAGGLIFHGEPDGNFVAFDAKTGDELWRFQTGFGADAPPMSYEVDGTQYVAIATGGQRSSPGIGDGLWTFSLKGKLGPLYAPPAPKTVVEFTSAPVATDTVTIGRLWDTPAKALGAKSEFTFAPERVRVAAGTTVTFTNEGDVPHTATAQDTTWDTGDIPSGGSARITFSTPGSFAYSCIPHPWMVGQVIVE
jgi:plastocyanin